MHSVFLSVALKLLLLRTAYFIDIAPPQLLCGPQKRIIDFLFSRALNGPLNSNFLKEQTYVAYPAYVFLTLESICNINCGIQVESLVYRNTLSFTTKLEVIKTLKSKEYKFLKPWGTVNG